MVVGESSIQLVREESDVTKRLKQDESEMGEDRISTLPDFVISDLILSRLLDTRFVISTGIISKRWQHLWKYVPLLVFTDESFRMAEPIVVFGFGVKAYLDFYNGVNSTLSQYRLESITKFEVDANYDNRFSSVVRNWINFALSRYVKEFRLHLSHSTDNDSYCIEDESFYKSPDFRSLDIGCCLLQPRVEIAWKNLKMLTISKCRLQQELIPNIVSGSSLLHSLVLCQCYGSFIDITSPSVKSLEILGYESHEIESLVEINAPYITYLRIVGSLWVTDISLKNVSSLVKTYLSLDFPRFYHKFKKKDEEFVVGEIIMNLKHVEEVQLGLSCYPALCRMAAKGFKLPPNVVGVDTSSMYYVDSDVEVSDSEGQED